MKQLVYFPFFTYLLAFLLLAITSFFATLIDGSSGLLAGQINEHEPHSIQSRALNSSALSNSIFSEKALIYMGCILAGQMVIHFPHRIQLLTSLEGTSFLVRHKIPELPFVALTSRVDWAIPIIGPPLIIFTAGSIKPPHCSTISE